MGGEDPRSKGYQQWQQHPAGDNIAVRGDPECNSQSTSCCFVSLFDHSENHGGDQRPETGKTEMGRRNSAPFRNVFIFIPICTDPKRPVSGIGTKTSNQDFCSYSSEEMCQYELQMLVCYYFERISSNLRNAVIITNN